MGNTNSPIIGIKDNINPTIIVQILNNPLPLYLKHLSVTKI